MTIIVDNSLNVDKRHCNLQKMMHTKNRSNIYYMCGKCSIKKNIIFGGSDISPPRSDLANGSPIADPC